MPSWCHMEGWLLNKDLPAKEQQSAEATINNAQILSQVTILKASYSRNAIVGFSSFLLVQGNGGSLHLHASWSQLKRELCIELGVLQWNELMMS